MALLTKSSQVRRVAMLWDVVQMSNGQYHLATPLIDGVILDTTKFASVPGSFQDTRSDLLPILGVSSFVLGFYWHN